MKEIIDREEKIKRLKKEISIEKELLDKSISNIYLEKGFPFKISLESIRYLVSIIEEEEYYFRIENYYLKDKYYRKVYIYNKNNNRILLYNNYASNIVKYNILDPNYSYINEYLDYIDNYRYVTNNFDLNLDDYKVLANRFKENRYTLRKTKE